MALLQIKIDDDLKARASLLFKELGIDFSTAVRLFLNESLKEGGIPFKVGYGEEKSKSNDILKSGYITSFLNGNYKMTLKEIDEEIRLAREERMAREAKEQEANNKNQ